MLSEEKVNSHLSATLKMLLITVWIQFSLPCPEAAIGDLPWNCFIPTDHVFYQNGMHTYIVLWLLFSFNLNQSSEYKHGLQLINYLTSKEEFHWKNTSIGMTLSLAEGNPDKMIWNTLGPKPVDMAGGFALPLTGSKSVVSWVSISHLKYKSYLLAQKLSGNSSHFKTHLRLQKLWLEYSFSPS